MVHRFWTKEELPHFTAEVRPPGRWREFVTDFFALSHATDLDGVGGFLQMILFARAAGRPDGGRRIRIPRRRRI